jgi:GNAT superfamily N-acetyltransferase
MRSVSGVLGLNEARLGDRVNLKKRALKGSVTLLKISQVSTSTQIHDVRQLLREYISWALTVADDGDQAPTFQGLEHELESLPGIYAPPTGSLLLARQDGQPAGCVALKGHDGATGELKRLYVRPAFRGMKIGRQLVAALVNKALMLGYQRMVLDSHISMKAAHAIYQAAGFRRVDTPSDFPEVLKPVVVFMEMDLDGI